MAKPDPDEKAMARVLRAFVTALDGDDYLWVYAYNALGGVPKPADRAAIIALREQGCLKLYRGGVNEDGDVCGGSGYAVTQHGRLWLDGMDQQQELPL